MGYKYILSEVRNRVGVITLNQPEKLNAMSGEMQKEYMEQVREWNDDSMVGSILFTGSGRAFSSGADIARFEANVANATSEGSNFASNAFEWITLARESKPIICAINGVAVGMGITFTLPCDIRVAAETARMSFRFVRIGLTPEFASTHYLINLVGLGKGMELMLTGKFVESDEALQIGLVNHVYPDNQFFEKSLALAAEIGHCPDWQLRMTKRLMYENYLENDTRKIVTHENDIFKKATRTKAHSEALMAFREKREPNYHGSFVSN